MKMYRLFILLFISIFSLQSCKDFSSSSGNSSSGNMLLPNISGAAGEVLVVMENTLWKEKPGNLLREALEQEYPALPQPEPLFDVIHITTGAFDNLFQQHRTIVIVSLSTEFPAASLSYFENVWAKPQLVVRINAPDSDALIRLLEAESSNLISGIQRYDRKRLIDVFKDSKDQSIRSLVSGFGIRLAIPRGYSIDMKTDHFASLSIETPQSSQVIFIYDYPHTGTSDLRTENIIEKRNAVLKEHTEGTRIGSYMTTAPLFPPLAYDLKIKGREIVEIRGLWELHKGFMGGPFISHTVVDEDRNRVVCVEGYVYNPNKKKRTLMRQVEAIVYSMELVK